MGGIFFNDKSLYSFAPASAILKEEEQTLEAPSFCWPFCFYAVLPQTQGKVGMNRLFDHFHRTAASIGGEGCAHFGLNN